MKTANNTGLGHLVQCRITFWQIPVAGEERWPEATVDLAVGEHGTMTCKNSIWCGQDGVEETWNKAGKILATVWSQVPLD